MASPADGLPVSPGTYALLLRCRRRRRVGVGALGSLALAPGAYLYVGSAFGPGGLRARLSRHAARSKPKRWHLDYVRPYLTLAGAWLTIEPMRREHDWARSVLCIASASFPLARLGASDCRCPSHFFRIDPPAEANELVARALRGGQGRPPTFVDAELLRARARSRTK